MEFIFSQFWNWNFSSRTKLFCSLSSGSLKNLSNFWNSMAVDYFVSCYLNLIATVDQLVDQFLQWLTLMTHKMKQNFWIERLYFEKEQFTEILYRGARICLWHIDTIVTLLWHHIRAIALSLHWVRSRIEVYTVQLYCIIKVIIS